ncbi:hypothetical protein [Ruegeria sp. PrR005]|uniref:Uncharacterized protein n=1 Tax=Ruegeria sp. PrR005 TaxID=2706882 RepID=A0A6B2NMB2_9RHOB|nr:hypothetical protein [Ruegeria sp. PrR005]NDW43657.1 hypothetical protein [Ruegeria sp. PrR005]
MDIGQIGEYIGLATSAVGLTGKASDTIVSIKALFEGGKTPDNEQVQRLLNTLAAELTSANMMNVQLSDALRALSQELQRQDDFEKEKARYELIETSQKDIVFRLREDAANGQPIHFICPVCLNRDKLISFVSGGYYKTCQTDGKHGFRFEKMPPARQVRMGDF